MSGWQIEVTAFGFLLLILGIVLFCVTIVSDDNEHD